jgi:hypothetical protein
MQCFGDQRFIHLGAIAVRRVDEVHAEFQRPAENAARIFAIAPPAPGIVPAQAHCAEAQAIYAEFADADGACMRRGSAGSPCHVCDPRC